MRLAQVFVLRHCFCNEMISNSQDRSVAAAAQAMELQAQAEIAQRSPQQQKLAEQYASNDVPRSGFQINA